MSPDGEVVTAPPDQFGAITNAHLIKFGKGSFWDTSFESSFNIDDQFPEIIKWLWDLSAIKERCGGVDRHQRWLSQPLPSGRRQQLSNCLASLIARSPRTRNLIRSTTEYYQKRLGFTYPKADKTLIAANMRGLYEAFGEKINKDGKLAILFTDYQVFIFGDGFFHNFLPTRDFISYSARCIIPLTPLVAAAFVKPMSYRREPQLLTTPTVSGRSRVPQRNCSGLLTRFRLL
jgi:hypothetical protein